VIGRGRRRRQRWSAGFDPRWRELVSRRLNAWNALDDEERERLEFLTMALMFDKRWEAANGFELTDEIQVTIASQAALLALGLPDDVYRKVRTILVHPTTLVMRGEHSQVPGIVSNADMAVLGLAEHTGTVMVAWDSVLSDARRPGNGHNVVIHEFAHQLDMLDGTTDGTPPLATTEQFQRWVDVCTDAYRQVSAGHGGRSLRSYAGVNPGEFFAVATEAFFDDARELRREHRELYEVLSEYYRQDPASRTVRQQRPIA